MKKNKTDKIHFGKKIALLRKEKGFSQTAFGEKIGLTKRAVSYYENKEDDFPSATIIKKMCKVLDVSFETFLKEQINTQKNNTSKLWKKIRKIEQLSPKDQKTIINMIDRLAEK